MSHFTQLTVRYQICTLVTPVSERDDIQTDRSSERQQEPVSGEHRIINGSWISNHLRKRRKRRPQRRRQLPQTEEGRPYWGPFSFPPNTSEDEIMFAQSRICSASRKTGQVKLKHLTTTTMPVLRITFCCNTWSDKAKPRSSAFRKGYRARYILCTVRTTDHQSVEQLSCLYMIEREYE